MKACWPGAGPVTAGAGRAGACDAALDEEASDPAEFSRCSGIAGASTVELLRDVSRAGVAIVLPYAIEDCAKNKLFSSYSKGIQHQNHLHPEVVEMGNFAKGGQGLLSRTQ